MLEGIFLFLVIIWILGWMFLLAIAQDANSLKVWHIIVGVILLPDVIFLASLFGIITAFNYIFNKTKIGVSIKNILNKNVR